MEKAHASAALRKFDVRCNPVLKKEHHGFSNPFLKMKIFQNVYFSKTISSSVKLIFKLWKNVSGQLTLECQLFQIR